MQPLGKHVRNRSEWVHGLVAGDVGTKRSHTRHCFRKSESDVRTHNTWRDQREKQEHMELRDQIRKMLYGTSACVFWLGFMDLEKSRAEERFI